MKSQSIQQQSNFTLLFLQNKTKRETKYVKHGGIHVHRAMLLQCSLLGKPVPLTWSPGGLHEGRTGRLGWVVMGGGQMASVVQEPHNFMAYFLQMCLW